MKGKSTYQKQKEKIAKLEYDILALTGRLSFEEQAIVSTRYKIKYNLDDQFMSGDISNSQTEFNGIFKKMIICE